MKQWHKLILALAAFAACALVGGIALAASSGATRSKGPTVQKATHTKAKSPGSPDVSQAQQGRDSTSGDSDNLQQGIRALRTPARERAARSRSPAPTLSKVSRASRRRATRTRPVT